MRFLKRKSVIGTVAAVSFLAISFLGTLGNLGAQGNVPTLDLSDRTDLQTVIAQGTPEIYQGHPYSVLLPLGGEGNDNENDNENGGDKERILVVWNIGHGGLAGPMAESVDEGKTWRRLDDRFPAGYRKFLNCPSIYRLTDAAGCSFLWIFASQPNFPRLVSLDDGENWQEETPLGFPNVMAFSSVIPKRPGVCDGAYLGFYHARRSLETGEILNKEDSDIPSRLVVLMSETDDAGWTWSSPRIIADVPEKRIRNADGSETILPLKKPCEPFAFWSPDRSEICCLMRENTHTGRSLVTFSRDEGANWSEPAETSWELTGDRHIGAYLSDGRLFIAFRDRAIGSETLGHFVGWVGTYEDIKNQKPGNYRVKLLHSYAGPDCGYPGVHALADGSVLALTYLKYRDDSNKHSVVSIKFQIEELDKIAKELQLEKK